MSYATPQEGIADLLINGAIDMPDIAWGTNASPFYQEVPETPIPALPYVWFDVAESTVEHTFEWPYNEKFDVTVRVYCREADIAAVASPYMITSPIYYLDTFRQTPRTMDGGNYQCIFFARRSWVLRKDAERGPDAGRVWIAEAHYDLYFTT